MWRETGNVAIEKTALQHSKSDWWIYKLHGGKGLYRLSPLSVNQLYRYSRKSLANVLREDCEAVPLWVAEAVEAEIVWDELWCWVILFHLVLAIVSRQLLRALPLRQTSLFHRA